MTGRGFQKQVQLQRGEVLLDPVMGGAFQNEAQPGMPSQQRDKKHIMRFAKYYKIFSIFAISVSLQCEAFAPR